MAEGSQGVPEGTPSKFDELMALLVPLELTRDGVSAHLWRLVACSDEILQVGAVCTLFDSGGIQRKHIAQIMPLIGHTSVCGRLFNYLLSRYEYDEARQLAKSAEDPKSLNLRERFGAILDENWAVMVNVEKQAFLNDGQIEHLLRAAEFAEKTAGWQEAVIWLLRAVLLTPVAPQPTGKLFTTLEEANRFAELRSLLAIYRKAKLHREMCLLLEASLCVKEENYAALAKIVPSISFDKLDERMRPKAFGIMARVCEAQGQYQEAIGWFEKQNDSGRAPPLGERNRFFAQVDRLEQIEVGKLSPDLNRNYFVMLGFPRSGTTLLENALAAHPQIETFEEVAADVLMFRAMNKIEARGITDPAERREGFEAARQRYYDDLQRRMRKSSANTYVDKLPLLTAYIRSLERVFPEKKYIFSIRHPYDVVLSCFQQRFKLNQAMENFRRFEDACTLYAQVMQRWFEAFPGPSERVHYVKYDDLVLNFDEELRNVLGFLQVGWDEAVRNFATSAERRKVATPSYSKVRAGLSLGVQTRWRNYRFLFEKPAAAPLKPWVERFGYEAM